MEQYRSHDKQEISDQPVTIIKLKASPKTTKAVKDFFTLAILLITVGGFFILLGSVQVYMCKQRNPGFTFTQCLFEEGGKKDKE